MNGVLGSPMTLFSGMILQHDHEGAIKLHDGRAVSRCRAARRRQSHGRRRATPVTEATATNLARIVVKTMPLLVASTTRPSHLPTLHTGPAQDRESLRFIRFPAITGSRAGRFDRLGLASGRAPSASGILRKMEVRSRRPA
jgi:hypothetical protein